MSSYVDTVRSYPRAGLRFSDYCHLLADTPEELHAMAARIGMPRVAFQDHPWRWHYDVPAHLRALAVEFGAREVTMHDVGDLLKRRRLTDTGRTPADMAALRRPDRNHFSG
ncbi:MAG: DUF4031 domain-containing protein [Jatrophihabitans sp.]